jgi:membrane-bound metal-dependent hydrolase YbcI (DUF457 family)
MFLGHFAVGFAAKRLTPTVSLATLFVAVQAQDLLWPLFLLLGVEHVRIDPGNTAMTPLDFYDYPFTHSLAGAAVIAVLIGGAYRLFRRDGRSAVILSLAAFSHWLLDFLTHRPDLPLLSNAGEKVGLGLWNSVWGSVTLELAMFAAGLALYAGGTRPKGKTGTYALASLAAILAGVYAANVFGPPPPGVGAIGVAGNAMWLFVLMAWWVDRNREAGKAKPVTASNGSGRSGGTG